MTVTATASMNRPERILRALVTGDMTTTQMVVHLAEGIDRTQQAQAWYGTILRRFEQGGQVVRVGRTPGGWQQGSSVIWAITDVGRAWLAQRNNLVAARHEAHASLVAQTVTLAAQAGALAAAQQQYEGMLVPREARLPVEQQLRGLGCSYAQIASVFGCSGELVRLDLLGGNQALPAGEAAA